MELVRTERLLETLTDQGLFEKLAVAVLRDADLAYRMLAHPGVNADGKTVRSPASPASVTLCALPVPPQNNVSPTATIVCATGC